MANDYDGNNYPSKIQIDHNYLNVDSDNCGDDQDDDSIMSFDTNLTTIKKRSMNEKQQENTWLHQIKMNSNIADAIHSTSLEDTASKYENYLNSLRRNYLENLSLSCPTSQKLTNNSPHSKEKQYSSRKTSTRRKILFTPNKENEELEIEKNVKSKKDSETIDIDGGGNENYDDEDESLSLRDNVVKPKDENIHHKLSTTQILSRIVQIREYLKQAYSMLTTLQTSNDITSYSTQLEKLNSLIDHLKDQEKGYMDLLNSIIAYQNATKELNDTKTIKTNNEENKQQRQQQSTISSAESSLDLDMNLRDLLFKIRQPINKKNQPTQHQQTQYLKLLSNMKHEKDIKILKQQYNINNINSYSNTKKDATESSNNSLVGSLMSDTIQLDNDGKYEDLGSEDANLNETEKLLEKERLVKSILARREEIRALEGRRKALEALKKAALESEKQILGRLDENATSNIKNQPQFASNSDRDEDETCNNETKADLNEPLFKTFYKYLNTNTNNNSENKIAVIDKEKDDDEKLEEMFDNESFPIVTAHEHEDKELLKGKLEDLQEKKRLVDKLIEDLNQLKEKANLVDGNENKQVPDKNNLQTYSNIKSELNKNDQELDVIKSSIYVSNSADNTAKRAEKLICLLENQEKLEKLHAMQQRLEQLKHIVGHFNEENSLKTLINDKKIYDENQNENNDMEIEDLSDSENIDDASNEMLLRKYEDRGKSNFSHLNSFLKIQGSKNGSIKLQETLKISNSEGYEEQKRKLAEAKLKLKELQNLITNIQNMPMTEQNIKTDDHSMIKQKPQENKINNVQINNRSKIYDDKCIIEYNMIPENKQTVGENEFMKTKRQQNLNLSNLNKSNISPKVELPQLSVLNESSLISQNKNNLDLTIFSDNGLNTSTILSGKNDATLIQQQREENSSPSDLLWSKMKQQLSLREKLRGKKKEFEDLIKNERYYLYEKLNKSKSDNKVDEDYDDTVTSDEDDNASQGKIYKTTNSNLDDSLFKCSLRKSTQQQQNLSSADELIMQANSNNTKRKDEIPFNQSIHSNTNLESSLVSSVMYNTNTLNNLKKQLEDNNHTFECMLKNQHMISNLLEKHLDSMNNCHQNQQQFQYQNLYGPNPQFNTSPRLSTGFGPSSSTGFLGPLGMVPPPPHMHPISQMPQPGPSLPQTVHPISAINDSCIQYNNNMQLQQLIFNLNGAYREIGMQRNEINTLMQKVHDITTHLQSQQPSQESSFISTENKQKEKDLDSTYLDNYLHKRNKSVISYDIDEKCSINELETGDENNLKIDIKHLKKIYNRSKYKTRSPSSSSSLSTNSSKTRTRSSVSTSIAQKSLSSNINSFNKSDSKNQIKSIITNLSSLNTASGSTITNPITNVTTATITNIFPNVSTKTTPKNNAASTVTSFDELRETIYSEVATLISQNETRPHYLLNLFRELQHLKTKNSRDQALKSIFNISSRHSTNDPSNVDRDKKEVNELDDHDDGNLDDTVIYLKMNAGAKYSNNYSTNSSTLSNKDENSTNKISDQVKLMMGKILKLVKYDKNEDKILDKAFLDNLNEKVIGVVRLKKENHDYLRLYEGQLNSYLKEALNKYENKPLSKSLNKILFDISDILVNELTFYSIMNNSNSSFHKKMQQFNEQQKDDSSNEVKGKLFKASAISKNLKCSNSISSNSNISNCNILVNSSPSLSSSISSAKKKNSNILNGSSITRGKETSFLLNNSSSSENGNNNLKIDNDGNYEEEFEVDDHNNNNEYDDEDDVADAEDENDYEVTADDGDYNENNDDYEEDENENDSDNDDDDDSSDDDNDEDKQTLYNIGDGSSIKKQLNNKTMYQNNDLVTLSSYEKYQIDPKNGISSGSGTLQSLHVSDNDYNNFFRSNMHNPISNNTNHFIELAQSEIKPYSRIGSDEDENEQDDDDEQFSDNLETAVSRQPDIAVVQQQKQQIVSQNFVENKDNINDQDNDLTVDDIPDKFNFSPNTLSWKDFKDNDLITVEQLILNSAPDELAESEELLPPSSSSSQHQPPLLENQYEIQDREERDNDNEIPKNHQNRYLDDTQINDFVIINNSKNFNCEHIDLHIDGNKTNESDV